MNEKHKFEIPYYHDFITEELFSYLKLESKPVEGIPGLREVGEGGGFESKSALEFLCKLYVSIKKDLGEVLNQRIVDRKFIDEKTKIHFEINKKFGKEVTDNDYQTVIGHKDLTGRIVIGPLNDQFASKGSSSSISVVPEYLTGSHVTLFGPPDTAKMAVNAMNAYHRKLREEPLIVQNLLDLHNNIPKWGADDEDSKTPLRKDLVSAEVNLTGCLEGTLEVEDEITHKKYSLEKHNLSLPIKRIPGLALPSTFLFYNDNPIPLHLYDFVIHFYKNWKNPKALIFYVPKLENEEEARYINKMIRTAEEILQLEFPSYKKEQIRLLIVLENPRAILRTHEIMDELYPYFVGASLGWHDFLGSTARLFKEDGNYRIPVKADPNIVIKYIQASHNLLADVVGPRGGIKIGGMYGILPMTNDLFSPSFQITIKGFIKDVITQMKRNLTGFWVAHPDFVRIGLAFVESWRIYKDQNDFSKLKELVISLLDKKYHEEILQFIQNPDIQGLDKKDPKFVRSLIVADIRESTYIANNHPDEIRYNVFQSLQYITDWLSGNGCVALPAIIEGVPVRVMDDLATAERSRWEVWHELYHKRFSIEEFIKIVYEELHFIKKDLSNETKIVQVKWDESKNKWYPIAKEIMLLLMTKAKPVEFATEYLLPFTVESVRNSDDPWKVLSDLESDKYKLNSFVKRLSYYFERCGALRFAKDMSLDLIYDEVKMKNLIFSFSKDEILDAAYFHGDIGEDKRKLDSMAKSEQGLVFSEEAKVLQDLQEKGELYKKKFGMKYLISAKGKTGKEILNSMNHRINNSEKDELENAKLALYEITKKRIDENPLESFKKKIENIFHKHKITGASISVLTNQSSEKWARISSSIQTISLGEGIKNKNLVTQDTWFEIASLSKTIASAFAIEYFKKKKIPLQTKVNSLFEKTKSDFRIPSKNGNSWGDAVEIIHLMNHSALNLHYVNGVPLTNPMPKIREFLTGLEKYSYEPVDVVNPPGEKFQYSGGGYLVLEHLIESLEEKSIFDLTKEFLVQLNLTELSFYQENISNKIYANGFRDNGEEIKSGRFKFPAFAAGAMGTTKEMGKFLEILTNAYHSKNGEHSISHETAISMLTGTDKGCLNFMGCKMGLGVFIGEAGENKFAIHQGANDGYRCIYLYCFDGPDVGNGFVIFCTSDFNGVLFNAEVAQEILKELDMKGIDYQKFGSSFNPSQLKKEEIVNIGYKNLIFDAFIKKE